MFWDKTYRRTTWLMWGLAGFLIGLAISLVTPSFHVSWLWMALLLAIVCIKSLDLQSLLSILLLGMLLGIARGNNFQRHLSEYKNFYDRGVVLVGRATSDGIYSDKAQLSFDLSEVKIVEPYEQNLIGKIAVEGFGEPSVVRGDMVQVEGKLRSGFGSRQGRLSFGELKVLGRDGSLAESTRREFVAGMQSSLPEPQASFGVGLLIGQRNTLPKEVLGALSAVGLTHIIAVSGYNLTIIVRGIKRMFAKKSKYQTLVAALLLIAGFLLITGLSASIVRAAIVSGLSLGAWYWGRSVRPVLLLLLVAALTAGWYPPYIWSDIGWHLSFLAFFGVLVLAPLLIRRFFKQKPKALTYVVIESLCAWAMTAPLILFIFNELSLIALLANAVVVPLVPWAMMLSFIAGLGGMFAAGISGWLAWPAGVLLTYMLDIAKLLSQIPHALTKHSLGVLQMSGLYLCLLLTSLILWHRTKNKHAKITEIETAN